MGLVRDARAAGTREASAATARGRVGVCIALIY